MTYTELLHFFFTECPEVVEAMRNADHHYDSEHLNPWHMEGDVLTHTLMVLREAEIMGVSDIVKLGCLFHDFAKPECRFANEETKRVAMYGHEGYSAIKAIKYMKKLNLSKKDMIHLIKMIALHTEVFRVAKPIVDESKFNRVPKAHRADAIKKEYNKKHNKILNKVIARYGYEKRLLKDLLTLGTCDHKGRFMDEERIDDSPENVEYRGQVINEVLEYKMPKRESKEDYPCLVMLVGVPCSGKSTWSRDFLLKNEDYSLVCRDDILEELYPAETYEKSYELAQADNKQLKVDKEFLSRIRAIVKEKKNLVVDKTNMPRKTRNSVLSISEVQKHYKKMAKVFMTDIDELNRRNEIRKEKGKFIKQSSYDRMFQAFYPPLIGEFDEVDWIIL